MLDTCYSLADLLGQDLKNLFARLPIDFIHPSGSRDSIFRHPSQLCDSGPHLSRSFQDRKLRPSREESAFHKLRKNQVEQLWNPTLRALRKCVKSVSEADITNEIDAKEDVKPR